MRVEFTGRLGMVMRRRAGVLLAALAAATFVSLPHPGAVAVHVANATSTSTDPQSTDNLDPETLATMRRQEALQPALQTIWDEQMKQPNSGFAGVAFEGNGISLYWKGALTSGMAAAVANARRTGPVVVKSAPFSANELQAEGDKIERTIKQLGATDIQSVGFAPDGAGLYVTRHPPATLTKIAANRRLHGKAPLMPAEQLVAEAGVHVPVTITNAVEETKFNVTRFTDFSPWNGGGKWVNSTRGLQCTTGFGVHSYGQSYVLTAAHCASGADYLRSGDGTYMGPVYYDDWAHEILLIDADGWHQIFDGAASTTNVKNVNSWGGWAANELVCQSGITSGTVCNIKQLYSINTHFTKANPDSDGDYDYTIYGMIRSKHIYGQTASQDGDSGAPVFTLDGTGVRAKGIVSSNCGGPQYMCFQDWGTILSRFAAYPNTSGTVS